MIEKLGRNDPCPCGVACKAVGFYGASRIEYFRV
jgi:hypothetical protein